MSPNFLEGDFVICAKFPWSIFKQNDVVLIQHPQYGMILKKIHSQVANQSFLLIGINLSESVSTQQMGIVSKDQIIGKVFWRIKPSGK